MRPMRLRSLFFVQLLRGQALNWAQAVLRTDPKITYADFLAKSKNVFERGTGAEAAAHRLLNLKQGRLSMADYLIEFWTLAEETGWGQSALISTLLNNLCDELKRELVMRELPVTLSDVMTLCVKVDENMRARRGARDYNSPKPLGREEMASGGGTASRMGKWDRNYEDEGEQPMQIGCSRLTPEERQQRWRAGECSYCSRKGHMAVSCSDQPKDHAHQ